MDGMVQLQLVGHHGLNGKLFGFNMHILVVMGDKKRRETEIIFQLFIVTVNLG